MLCAAWPVLFPELGRSKEAAKNRHQEVKKESQNMLQKFKRRFRRCHSRFERRPPSTSKHYPPKNDCHNFLSIRHVSAKNAEIRRETVHLQRKPMASRKRGESMNTEEKRRKKEETAQWRIVMFSFLDAWKNWSWRADRADPMCRRFDAPIAAMISMVIQGS